MVVDDTSRKLLFNSVSEDDILNLNVTNVEQIEHRRTPNPEMDALYILSPLPHIVDCLMADFERKRYRMSHLVWTSSLNSEQRTRIERSPLARERIASFQIVNVDFYPRESHVVTFRDPWSFPILFHPACNNLIRGHLQEIAQRVVSVCASLGEYPVIRYYKPRMPTHEASVLCSHLARFIQDELDRFAQFQRDFPPPSNRPRGVLVIVDRSMDMITPLLHEFTYQALAHDLLPLQEGDKITYKTIINEGAPNEETKEMEISEKDKVWVDYRHVHMKDVLERLGEDFAKFRAANAQFDEKDKASVDTIRQMLAGLSDFQEGKNIYTLHLNMAHECMKYFQDHKLLEVSSVEQCLATGLDENYKKAKNLAEQLVQLLDDDSIGHPERLRLLLLYLIYRRGLLPGDIKKLMAHGNLPSQDGEIIYNLDLLGVRVEKHLKEEKRPAVQPLFNRKPPPATEPNEIVLSRYEPNVKLMLEELLRGTLDSTAFPFTRPQTEPESSMPQNGLSQSSLRSAKPTWARTRSNGEQPKQRIIVFMAGGATYSEARACYEISQAFARDVYLATSHMLTPGMFLRQVGDLSADKRQLDIPAERPKPQAPAHLFEADPPPAPKTSPAPAPAKPSRYAVPTAAMGAMSLGSNGSSDKHHKKDKDKKDKDKEKDKDKDKKDKDKKEKKRHHFFIR